MRAFLQSVSLLALGFAAALAWAGMVCFNSGDPEYTDQFWLFGLVALLAAFATFAASTLSCFGEEA